MAKSSATRGPVGAQLPQTWGAGSPPHLFLQPQDSGVTTVGSAGTWDAAISGDRGEKQGRKEKLRPGLPGPKRDQDRVTTTVPVPQGSPVQRVPTVCRLGGLMCPGAEDVQRPQGGWSQCWRREGGGSEKRREEGSKGKGGGKEKGGRGEVGRKGWQGPGFREDIAFDLEESGSHGGWWAEEGGG